MDSQIIIDGFLDNFDAFREHCDFVEYEGVVNPVDDVFYPGVSLDIPEHIKDEVVGKLQKHIGLPIKVSAMFLRLSVEGILAPHQAHTDLSMGEWSLMFYVNRDEDCEGGTSFVRHVDTGLCQHPITEEELELWKTDHSKPSKWQIMKICDMRPNRACVFPSKLMHRADPIGGFGHNAKNGRLVMTLFFDVIQ